MAERTETEQPSGWKEQQPQEKIDLNSASKEDLMRLKGISERRAEKILEARARQGGFKSVDDLKNVEGFDEKLVEDLRPAATVGEKSRH
jgi:competence protein ComEA